MATKAEVILSVLGLEIGGEMTEEKINEVFRNLKDAKKIIDEYEKKTLKPFLFESAEKLGTVTENGGFKVVTENGTGWEKQARNSVSVDGEGALNLLKDKKLDDYISITEFVSDEDMDSAVSVLKGHGRMDLVTVKEEVHQSELEQAYLKGFISDDELSSIVTRKTTYALVEVKAPKKKK